MEYSTSHTRGREVTAMVINDDWRYVDRRKMAHTVYRTIELLMTGDYDALIAFCHGNALPIDDMRRELYDWPHKFIMPPSNRIEDLIYGLIELKGTPHRWAVDANLWTEEEGISDLMLELILTDSKDEYYDVQIQDMDVL